MNIGLTGASGFIGQAVQRRLKKETGSVVENFDKDKHNLLDPESLKSFVKGKDVIVHLAGRNKATSLELVETNTLGTLCLLEAVLKHAPNARIVFASTFQVYLPKSLYGLSKKFAEDLLVQYGLNHKIQSTILRLANVYGPNGKPFYNSVIATFAHQIKRGETLNINGDGSQERDYVYIEDVADAFVCAALLNQKGQTKIVDICSGISTKLKEIINTLTKFSGKTVNVVYNNAVQENPWPTKDKNFNEAKKILGWEPKTNLEKGLENVIK